MREGEAKHLLLSEPENASRFPLSNSVHDTSLLVIVGWVTPAEGCAASIRVLRGEGSERAREPEDPIWDPRGCVLIDERGYSGGGLRSKHPSSERRRKRASPRTRGSHMGSERLRAKGSERLRAKRSERLRVKGEEKKGKDNI